MSGVKVIGCRKVGDILQYVGPDGAWTDDPDKALQVVLEGDPTVAQQAAAERNAVAFLGGYRQQAELSATVRELYDAVNAEIDEGSDDERERAFARMQGPLKEAFLRARAAGERAEWVGLWNACFMRGPESWRKLDSVVADDAVIFALRTSYNEATAELREGKAKSSGR